MAVIGYARVSTTEQNLDLQLTALQAAGAARIFADNGVSGSTTERPQLSKAMERLEAGDVLTVWKLDRLGRNTRHVLDVIETIRERGVGFRSLTEGLDTTGPMGTAMLTIMAAFAQLERDTMGRTHQSRTRRSRGQQPPRRKAPQSGRRCCCPG
jgi:DNA invertase Pin-like site-specific DNA recombinase